MSEELNTLIDNVRKKFDELLESSEYLCEEDIDDGLNEIKDEISEFQDKNKNDQN